MFYAFFRSLLGGQYRRLFVFGKGWGGSPEEEVMKEKMKSLGVEVKRFDQVVREFAKNMTVRPMDDAGQLLHILRAYGFLDEKQTLEGLSL